MTEILPCPFCGGEADEYEGDYGNGICCMMCGAMVGEPIHLEYRTTKRVSIAEAIAAWNTRAERTCKNDIDGDEKDFACSECRARLYIRLNGDYTMILKDETLVTMPNYCPNCGAKVIGD